MWEQTRKTSVILCVKGFVCSKMICNPECFGVVHTYDFIQKILLRMIDIEIWILLDTFDLRAY